MLKLLLDENFNNDVLRGLLRRKPDMDYVRAQDVDALSGAADPIVLEWAAQEGRVLLAHDVRTITHYAYARIREGKPMPGVFEVSRSASMAQLIDDIWLLVECSEPGEWEGQVRYIPLR